MACLLGTWSEIWGGFFFQTLYIPFILLYFCLWNLGNLPEILKNIELFYMQFWKVNFITMEDYCALIVIRETMIGSISYQVSIIGYF